MHLGRSTVFLTSVNYLIYVVIVFNFLNFLLTQLQFCFSELFSDAATVFFLPELILHKYSVEGYVTLSPSSCWSLKVVDLPPRFLALTSWPLAPLPQPTVRCIAGQRSCALGVWVCNDVYHSHLYLPLSMSSSNTWSVGTTLPSGALTARVAVHPARSPRKDPAAWRLVNIVNVLPIAFAK